VSLAKLDIAEVVFVLLFVGLPLLRSILGRNKDAAGQAKPARPRGPRSTGKPVSNEEHAGRDMWERMLRGELPEPEDDEPDDMTVPPLPEPVPEVATVFVDPPPRRAPVPLPSLLDEERVAEALAYENAQLANRWGEAAQVPVRLRTLDRAETLGLGPSEEVAIDGAYAIDQGVTRGAYDLRAAIIASEVLGAPVSLRRDGIGGSTPPGLAF